MADVLQSLSGKRVFLFGTAGFGRLRRPYFDRILTGVRGKLPQDTVYLGGAMCQGKMPQSVRQRYEGMLAQNPDDPKIKAMIENFDVAQPHPTKEDLAAIISARQILPLSKQRPGATPGLTKLKKLSSWISPTKHGTKIQQRHLRKDPARRNP